MPDVDVVVPGDDVSGTARTWPIDVIDVRMKGPLGGTFIGESCFAVTKPGRENASRQPEFASWCFTAVSAPWAHTRIAKEESVIRLGFVPLQFDAPQHGFQGGDQLDCVSGIDLLKHFFGQSDAVNPPQTLRRGNFLAVVK